MDFRKIRRSGGRRKAKPAKRAKTFRRFFFLRAENKNIAAAYFSALNESLTELYKPCGCDACRKLNLANPKNNNPVFQKVLNAGEKAFKQLYKKQSYKPEDLANVKEYKNLIGETASVFKLGISQEVPEEMKSYLEKDAFVFSGLKTHAQLAEARNLLKDKNGEIKPQHLFEQDILKLNEKYNLNYLDAEYQFAQSSAQSAANWANLNTGERYNLQYRTAGDSRVRDSHAAINGTTLPKNSDFWLSYYPPNGWRCRCVAVQVLAGDYPASDEEKANAAADKATTQIGKDGKNRLAMFRFNPGAEQKIFPPKHPYNKVQGADKVKEIVEDLIDEKENHIVKLQKQYGKKWKVEKFFDKTDGYIVVEEGHGKAEKEQNILSFTPLAKNGKKVELVKQQTIMKDNIKQKLKTYDAIIVNNKERWEAKMTKNYTNLKNISDKAIQSENQGAEIMLIDVYKNKYFNVDDLVKGVGFSFEKTNLTGICLMIESNRYEIISRNNYETGKYESLVRKMIRNL